MPFPRPLAALLSVFAFALAAVGCGGSSMTSSNTSSSPSKVAVSDGAGSAGTSAMSISTTSNPELGTIVVDPQGLTLYDFEKDKGTESTCYGACAKIWPPLTTSGAPQAGEGAMSSKLGTSKRNDGTTQVTYAGHPLYTYAADKSPGETNGNGISAFGGSWHALNTAGSAVTSSANKPAPTTTTESSGGGGYGY